MPHDHLAVLKVEHGERSQAGGDAGETRHGVGTVQLQQALQGWGGREGRAALESVCGLRIKEQEVFTIVIIHRDKSKSDYSITVKSQFYQ